MLVCRGLVCGCVVPEETCEALRVVLLIEGLHGGIKRVKAHGGCLGTGRRGRTWQAAISRGEPHAGVDPRMSEWGNPAGVMPGHPVGEHIARRRRTRGTETSQYLEEKETRVIPSVAASERGVVQTVRAQKAAAVALAGLEG